MRDLRACLWLGIKWGDAFSLKLCYTSINILHFNAYVVDSTRSALLQKVRDGAIFTKRVQKLDIGVVQLHKNCCYSMVGLWLFIINNGCSQVSRLVVDGKRAKCGP